MEHEMMGYIDGDWAKFYCPDCDKVRWINQKTGEMRHWGGDFYIKHFGQIGPVKMSLREVRPDQEVKPEIEAWLKSTATY